MENDFNRVPDQAGDDHNRSQIDVAQLEQKWGVSREEIEEAIRHVGADPSEMEEYLLNKKWQKTGSANKEDRSFQQRDLNEDETY